MDDYVDLDEDYRPNKKEMSDYNPRYKQQRQAETPCVFCSLVNSCVKFM